jgi:hypothetical protein
VSAPKRRSLGICVEFYRRTSPITIVPQPP